MTIAKAHTVACPECGAPMKLRESKHGLFYGCSRFPACKGSHGAHPNGAPLGTPADVGTKQARIRAHTAFDQLWKPMGARLTRDEAYLWVQSKMGLKSSEAHIGKFSTEQCDALVKHVEQYQQAKAAA